MTWAELQDYINDPDLTYRPIRTAAAKLGLSTKGTKSILRNRINIFINLKPDKEAVADYQPIPVRKTIEPIPLPEPEEVKEEEEMAEEPEIKATTYTVGGPEEDEGEEMTEETTPVVIAEEPEPLRVFGDNVVEIRQGEFLNRTLEVEGGTPPYHWSAEQIPPGLHLYQNGHISGSTKGLETGRHAFVVEVKDSQGDVARIGVQVYITPAPIETDPVLDEIRSMRNEFKTRFEQVDKHDTSITRHEREIGDIRSLLQTTAEKFQETDRVQEDQQRTLNQHTVHIGQLDEGLKEAKRMASTAIREVRQATKSVIASNLLSIAGAAAVIAAVVFFLIGLYLFIADVEMDFGREAYLWFPPVAAAVVFGLLTLGILILMRSRDTEVSENEEVEEEKSQVRTINRQRRRR